jgi:hypothetical protein
VARGSVLFSHVSAAATGTSGGSEKKSIAIQEIALRSRCVTALLSEHNDNTSFQQDGKVVIDGPWQFKYDTLAGRQLDERCRPRFRKKLQPSR